MSNTNWDCSVCGKPVEEHTTELAKAHYERLMTPAVEESMDRSEAVSTIREAIPHIYRGSVGDDAARMRVEVEAALGWLVEYCDRLERERAEWRRAAERGGRSLATLADEQHRLHTRVHAELAGLNADFDAAAALGSSVAADLEATE